MPKKRKKSDKEFYKLLLRYIFLIAVAIPNLWLFYKIFTPLTIYPAYFLFNIFFGATLLGNTILVGGKSCFPIEIIPACVAGAAYYLLLIFNLSIPNIKIKKRLSMIIFAFGTLLIANILRIFILGFMFISESAYFDITHKITWNLLSGIFIALIWIAEVKIFKIKEIPIYSDLRFLYKASSLKK